MMNIQNPKSKRSSQERQGGGRVGVQKGFTFIEVMVAIFILSVGILAILIVFPLGIEMTRCSKMTTVATQLAQAKIEEIISTPYEQISNAAFPNEAEVSGFTAFKRVTVISCVNPSLQKVTCNYDPNDPNPLKKVEITVSWGMPTKEIELTTLISSQK